MTSNTPETQELLQVTAEDRELAQRLCYGESEKAISEAAMLLARHRQSSSNAGGADVDEIRRIDVGFLNAHALTCEEEGLHKIAAAFRGIAQRIDATPTAEPIDDRPDIVGDPVCKIAAYNECHETARELGYPSLTEALEHLSELKEALTTPPTPDRILPDTVREALAAIKVKATCAGEEAAVVMLEIEQIARRALSATPAQKDRNDPS